MRHPLDPLTYDEVAAVTSAVRADERMTEATSFVYVDPLEPPKDHLLAESAPALRRLVAVLVYERARRIVSEVVVSVDPTPAVERWEDIPDARPPMLASEFALLEEIVRRDERWQSAMRRRGVSDFSKAVVDAWAPGHFEPADAASRILWGLTFVRESELDNYFARPVEGLVVRVDMDSRHVLDVIDEGVIPIPSLSGNYRAGSVDPSPTNPPLKAPRTGLRPIQISQPEGVSFVLIGAELEWQNWRLRIGWTSREGLVLHQLAYNDGPSLRSIAHRLSVSELFVPYGDPGLIHARKNALDLGEAGLGLLANSLELGCDCLGAITYVDAAICDNDGNPVAVKNAVCIHEEDSGIGWKHTDTRTGQADSRRSRRLVISAFYTVGNYEYGVYWHLYLDGTIEFIGKLTGIVSTGAYEVGREPAYGTVVAPGLYAPNHQHFFTLRLDLDIDGRNNTVHEVAAEAVPVGPSNPFGNAWIARSRQLVDESTAARDTDPSVGRYWRIASTRASGGLRSTTGYRLIPGPNATMLLDGAAPARRRGSFASKHFWATAYDDRERYAPGAHPGRQSPGGLEQYVAANRSLDGTDLVVWYTAVSQHIVRPEDWPVMPVQHVRFHLEPDGFFQGNPALDVPDLHRSAVDANLGNPGQTSACSCGCTDSEGS